MGKENMESEKRIFYGWIIVGIAFLIMSITYAIWYSFPVFYVPILETFGWSRADTALICSIGSIVYGFGSAIGGIALDRVGPKKSYTFATVILALGLVGCSRATEIWQFFFFWGVLASLGIAMVGFVPCVAIVSNWFNRRRAAAIGIAQAGGRESFLMTPLVQYFIQSLGWRPTYLVLAASAMFFIGGPAQFLRYSPKEMGLLPDGDEGDEEGLNPGPKKTTRYIVDKEWVATDWTLTRGLKEYRFWCLFGTLFFMAFGYGVAMTHQVVFVVDIGFTAMFASFLFLVYGVMSMAGRFCGFFSDIIGREPTYALGCGGIAIGFLMLIIVRDTTGAWMLYVYAGFFGFFSGLNSPTYASAAADIFEGKHFGAILGFANIGYGLGNSLGAWLGGYIFDMFGNYIPAFIIAIMMLGVGCILLWIASPRKIRLTGTRLPAKFG